jgi:hypothetical protein
METTFARIVASDEGMTNVLDNDESIKVADPLVTVHLTK